MKRVDNSKAPRQQTMFFEVLKSLEMLDKKFDAVSIELLKKANTVIDILEKSVKIWDEVERGGAPISGNIPDLPPSLMEKLEKTEDGGLKLKAFISKENFHAFNAQMWDNGYKYEPKKGWYPR
jgi:hypothetical protein